MKHKKFAKIFNSKKVGQILIFLRNNTDFEHPTIQVYFDLSDVVGGAAESCFSIEFKNPEKGETHAEEFLDRMSLIEAVGLVVAVRNNLTNEGK